MSHDCQQEHQGDPIAHLTHEGTGTTSSSRNTSPRDTIQTQITQLGTVKKPDGSLTENTSETLDVMTEVHFATHVGGVYPPTDTQTTRADDSQIPRKE